jgi:DNA-binding GntR family transcriptional regulator
MKRTTAADRAYALLRDWLSSGRLDPAARISERALSEDLDLSRTPLRAALARLEGDGLLRRLPSGVLEVAQLTEGSATDLYACRSALEVLAVELAIEKASNDQLNELQQFIDEAARAYVQNELDQVVKLNTLFHSRLVTLAGNTWLDGLLHPLQPHFDRLRRLLVVHIRPSFVAEHQAILDAVKEREIDRARQAVRGHIAEVLWRVVVTPGAVARTP